LSNLSKTHFIYVNFVNCVIIKSKELTYICKNKSNVYELHIIIYYLLLLFIEREGEIKIKKYIKNKLIKNYNYQKKIKLKK
jgi:hypothetical protein